MQALGGGFVHWPGCYGSPTGWPPTVGLVAVVGLAGWPPAVGFGLCVFWVFADDLELSVNVDLKRRETVFTVSGRLALILFRPLDT